MAVAVPEALVVLAPVVLEPAAPALGVLALVVLVLVGPALVVLALVTGGNVAPAPITGGNVAPAPITGGNVAAPLVAAALAVPAPVTPTRVTGTAVVAALADAAIVVVTLAVIEDEAGGGVADLRVGAGALTVVEVVDRPRPLAGLRLFTFRFGCMARDEVSVPAVLCLASARGVCATFRWCVCTA